MICRATVALLLSLSPPMTAIAAAETAGSVNAYTAAEERQAGDTAKQAGYAPVTLAFVQAGNFFFNASRDGKTYSVTVTPDGKVYASTPVNLPAG